MSKIIDRSNDVRCWVCRRMHAGDDQGRFYADQRCDACFPDCPIRVKTIYVGACDMRDGTWWYIARASDAILGTAEVGS